MNLTGYREKIYNVNHKGQTAIICGSAPCLLEHFKVAEKNNPAAEVIVVNGAARGVYGDFLATYHHEELKEFKSNSLNKEIITLTSHEFTNADADACVDYRFHNIRLGATSIGDALQIAKQMGFSEILLVGAPMNGKDGYFYNAKETGDCPRFGLDKIDGGQIQYHQMILKSIKEDFLDNIKISSCCGFTKELFGGIDGCN